MTATGKGRRPQAKIERSRRQLGILANTQVDEVAYNDPRLEASWRLCNGLCKSNLLLLWRR